MRRGARVSAWQLGNDPIAILEPPFPTVGEACSETYVAGGFVMGSDLGGTIVALTVSNCVFSSEGNNL